MTAQVSARRTRSVLRSSVMLHALMAAGGVIMVLFLLAHMYGNLKVFAGAEAFDGYAAHLRELGEPLLPHSGALWVLRIVLLAAVLTHMTAAVVLWRRMRSATAGRGSRRYRSTKNPRGVQRSYASFTMRWGGVVIALFVIYHLLHLTVNVIAPGGASDSPYQRMVSGFSIWWVTLSYLIALAALGLHLRHGIWSAFASLGANTSIRRRRHLNQLAWLVTGVIILGFLLPPLAIQFGVVS